MNERVRDRGRRTLGWIASPRRGRSRDSELVELRRRVADLEDEMQESRRLNRRLAELTDIVQELLVPLAQRDEEKVREYLDRYSNSL